MDIEELDNMKERILNSLKPLDPEKVILFGSYARGTAGEDSDVDLYVVTGDEGIPRNYDEKRKIVRKVSKRIEDIREEVGVDLLVHTKEMNRKFEKMNSSFSRELRGEGVRLV